MIDIVHRYTRAVLYHSETAQTIAEAVAEAQTNNADLWDANLQDANLRGADLRGANLQDANLRGADLWGANLQDANLQDANLWDANLRGANLQDANLWDANLRGANLRGANLWGANLPLGYRVATLCFGGWIVTVMPTETSIGCERHPNEQWLAWSADAPEIAAMHPDATAWWTQHRESVCAVIQDVMRP